MDRVSSGAVEPVLESESRPDIDNQGFGPRIRISNVVEYLRNSGTEPPPRSHPMLPYRIIHWIGEVYPVTVMFLYIGLALFTFAICFLIPAAAVVLLIFSVFALVPAVCGWRILKASERWLARGSIRQHRCPSCGDELHGEAETDCLSCGISWEPSGSQNLA